MADLNWYRNFIAVYRSGSVSGAARVRHLTQPAISQQLSALESSLGEPLFVRTPKGMQPTERGKLLYAQVVESLDRLESITRQSRRTSAEETRPIRIGTSPEFFEAYILPRIASSGLRVHAQFGDTKGTSLFTQLQAGTLDVVVGVQRANMRAIEEQIILEKRFYLVGPSQIKPPSKADQLASWIRSQPWVGYSADLPMIRRFFSTQFGSRFSSPLALIVPDLRAVRSAVMLGLGISILPDFLCLRLIENRQLCNIWPDAEVIPNEQWLMAYRDVDTNRAEILQLAALLKKPDLS
jgi:DNA-binding transcriptional LysR family regulator